MNFSRLMNKRKNPRAETLAEVILALVVLGVGAVAAVTMVNASIRANAENEQRLTAYNFAREAVEAVRNIRDTNWLRFPSNRTECWDVMLTTTDPTQCTTASGATKIADGTYIIYPELNDTSRLFSWNMMEATSSVDTTLYVVEIDGQTIYTHDPTGTSGWDPTPYSRTITITSSDTDSDGNADEIQVEATVTWIGSGREISVTFMDELTNY